MSPTITKMLKSRTVWTIAAMFVIGGIQNVTQFMPADLAHFVTGTIAVAAIYFKLNPSQEYGK
jgi:hypothetical protein